MSAERVVTHVLITPDDLQEHVRQAYLAGCHDVQENYSPLREGEDPEFGEASYDYVASLDFTATTRPGGRLEISLDTLPFWPWLWADPFRDDVGTRKEMAERRLRANYEVARDPIPNQYALVHRADLVSQMHELWTLRARVGPPAAAGDRS